MFDAACFRGEAASPKSGTLERLNLRWCIYLQRKTSYKIYMSRMRSSPVDSNCQKNKIFFKLKSWLGVEAVRT